MSKILELRKSAFEEAKKLGLSIKILDGLEFSPEKCWWVYGFKYAYQAMEFADRYIGEQNKFLVPRSKDDKTKSKTKSVAYESVFFDEIKNETKAI